VKYLHDTDPYRHNIVIHTCPNQQDKVYTPLLGDKSLLTGVCVAERLESGSPTHVAMAGCGPPTRAAPGSWPMDEQGPASLGVPPDRVIRATTAWRACAKIPTPMRNQTGSNRPGPEETKGYTLQRHSQAHAVGQPHGRRGGCGIATSATSSRKPISRL